MYSWGMLHEASESLHAVDLNNRHVYTAGVMLQVSESVHVVEGWGSVMYMFLRTLSTISKRSL